MSWNGYIVSWMEKKPPGKLKGCAIHGHLDGAVWAQSDQFKPSVEEVMKLNDKEADLFQNGVYLAGVKYVVLRYQLKDDSNPYMALKTAGNPEGGHCMGCVYKSKKAFLIAIGEPETQGGEVITAIGKTCDYLKSQDY